MRQVMRWKGWPKLLARVVKPLAVFTILLAESAYPDVRL